MEPEKPSPRRIWRFTPQRDGDTSRWMWQLFAASGRLIRSSRQHDTYLAALTDALQRGFKPNLHDYSVDLPHGRMHFPPGQEPEYFLMSQSQESRPQRTRKREADQSQAEKPPKP